MKTIKLEVTRTQFELLMEALACLQDKKNKFADGFGVRPTKKSEILIEELEEQESVQ